MLSIFFPFLVSSSLNCYTCQIMSDDDCREKATPLDCGEHYSKCVKTIDRTGKQEKVSKTCGTKEICDLQQKNCKDSGKCEVQCCESNLCNAGVPLVFAGGFLAPLSLCYVVYYLGLL